MKGRSIVALILLGFVAVATGVIWRRSYGTARAREESGLLARRAALVAERAKLEGDIRDASSRARLGRVAEERLHMRVPNDSQVIYLEPMPIADCRKPEAACPRPKATDGRGRD